MVSRERERERDDEIDYPRDEVKKEIKGECVKEGVGALRIFYYVCFISSNLLIKGFQYTTMIRFVNKFSFFLCVNIEFYTKLLTNTK